MPIDYARRSEKYVTRHWNQKLRKKTSHFPWLGLLGLLLLISLFGYGLFYVSHYKPHLSFRPKIASVPLVASEKTKISLMTKRLIAVPVVDKSVQSAPPVQFDFYQMLPKMEVNVSADDNTAQSAKTDSATRVAKTEADVYYLQLASLTDQDQAKSFQATLTQQGFQTILHSIDRNGTTFYRVQMGPYHSRDEASDAQAALEKQNISSVIVDNIA